MRPILELIRLKNEDGMDEDESRNPACIADNVGDNVGGMGATSTSLILLCSGELSFMVTSGCCPLICAAPGDELLQGDVDRSHRDVS